MEQQSHHLDHPQVQGPGQDQDQLLSQAQLALLKEQAQSHQTATTRELRRLVRKYQVLLH